MKQIQFALFSLLLASVATSAAEEVYSAGERKSEQLEQEDEASLQRHFPFYFAYNSHLSKLQISLKTPLVRKVPFYFGYTQLMFWALRDDSRPFRDLTYNPELFYRFKTPRFAPLKYLDFGIYSHNSNGKAGTASRSYNKSYLRAHFEIESSRWVTGFSAQAAHLYAFDPTNKDIQNYIGALSFGVNFIQLFDSWVDKSEVSLQVLPGGKFGTRFDRGGYQLSWSFRLGGLNVVPSFYAQYYHGYAETLLNYNQKADVFRIGFIF
ncbi:MAG: phospholipase A [Bdellovibrionales bacterium]